MKKGKKMEKEKPVKKNLRKGAATRERILSAALKVFARHSYNAGSIRMIGKEGGFDHGIIRYHFTNKAELFEAVVARATEEFYNKHEFWLKNVADKSPGKGFSLFLDLMLGYSFKHPEIIRLFIKNLSQTDKSDITPGYQLIPDLMTRTKHLAISMIPIRASNEAFDRFADTFNMQIFNLVGAASAQAAILGLNPDSRKYRKWVKDTLMYIFLPHFKKLINPDRQIEF